MHFVARCPDNIMHSRFVTTATALVELEVDRNGFHLRTKGVYQVICDNFAHEMEHNCAICGAVAEFVMEDGDAPPAHGGCLEMQS